MADVLVVCVAAVVSMFLLMPAGGKEKLPVHSIIPYDALAEQAQRSTGPMCWERRGGKHHLVSVRGSEAIVRYESPKTTDLFTGVYPPTLAHYREQGLPPSMHYRVAGSPEAMRLASLQNAQLCADGDLLRLPTGRYKTETCAYEMSAGLRERGFCGSL